MKDKTYLSGLLALTFIWCGLVLGISFLEAWLKFRAPGISLSLGLGIGRLVFAALNKIEWVVAAAIVLFLWLYERRIFIRSAVPLAVGILILMVQTFWLLPALDAAAQVIIDGGPRTSGSLHITFVLFEAAKVLSVLSFGIWQVHRAH